ncbi:MAG: DUF1385 domain-containing protein [Armatimonadetes bacterium]|nr:DUF1385 domain-containing protein [Armatimonadota bacterium]MDE2207126.1 DUF1385 domain-containing protein [Armatimonadota bacterium]
MPNLHRITDLPISLRTAISQPLPLDPSDSVQTAVYRLRVSRIAVLPVLDGDRLVGLFSLRDLMQHSAGAAPGPDMMLAPVAKIAHAPQLWLPTTFSPTEAMDALLRSGLEAAPVGDGAGTYFGMVSLADLLTTPGTPPRPLRIGGMATPFGVYLTDGSRQAGAGNLALAATGALLFVLILLATGLVTVVAAAVDSVTGLRLTAAIALMTAQAAPRGGSAFALIAVQAVVVLTFLTMMHLTRLAAFHGAEHQAVHAVERGEPLVESIVQRMPLAHPRCGTNLMTAAMLFTALTEALSHLPTITVTGAASIAALSTLASWRTLGTQIQLRFTTRRPRHREIVSGIRAAQQLVEQYGASQPARATVLRRIWCAGVLQTAAGMLTAAMLANGVLWLGHLVRL